MWINKSWDLFVKQVSYKQLTSECLQLDLLQTELVSNFSLNTCKKTSLSQQRCRLALQIYFEEIPWLLLPTRVDTFNKS